MTSPQGIEVSDPQSWPADLRAWVEQLDRSGREIDPYMFDEEAELRTLLGERTLRAYHASRLLDYELDWIRERGLLRLNRDFLEHRVDVAHARGFITAAERDQVLRGNAYAVGNQHGRDGLLSLILGRAGLDNAAGVNPLLGTWGGEGIHGWPLPGREENLRTCGVPTIVAIQVHPRPDDIGTPVTALLLTNLREPGSAYGDLIRRIDLPPHDIVDVWQPGHPEFDRHPELTRD
jgi:hypothetical protein